MGRFSNLLGATSPEPKQNSDKLLTEVPEETPAEFLTEVPEETPAEFLTEVPVRSRNDRGHFIADDPNTPENEAWVGGTAPAKKKRPRKKKTV